VIKLALEIGRVCLKIAGRESGKYCVVVKKLKDEKTKSENFVLITGPKLLTGVKRRRANIQHLKPLPYILEIKEDASDEEVIAAYQKAGLVTKLNLKLPSAAEVKAEKEIKEKKPKEKGDVKEKKPKK
jgi:large subunit ribosomal protein L14e